MAKLLLVSHSDFCKGALHALKMFAGDAIDASTISLGDDGVESFRNQLRDAVESVEGEILVVTDLAGGTPCNEATALALADPERIHVVAGMNLPMLVECSVALMTGASVELAVEKGVDAGRHGMHPIDLSFGESDGQDRNQEDDLF